jgi:hypothetical protein
MLMYPPVLVGMNGINPTGGGKKEESKVGMARRGSRNGS